MACGGGACAREGEANIVAASVADPLSTVRLESVLLLMMHSLSCQRPAALRRQPEPDLGALGNEVVGSGDDAQWGAVRGFNEIIARRAEKHLAGDACGNHVLLGLRCPGREHDVV